MIPPESSPLNNFRGARKWFAAYAETEEDTDVSNLRVQKLLYYAQGHYLATKGIPLFDEAIQA